jgi:uncharacterized membrane protein
MQQFCPGQLFHANWWRPVFYIPLVAAFVLFCPLGWAQPLPLPGATLPPAPPPGLQPPSIPPMGPPPPGVGGHSLPGPRMDPLERQRLRHELRQQNQQRQDAHVSAPVPASAHSADSSMGVNAPFLPPAQTLPHDGSIRPRLSPEERRELRRQVLEQYRQRQMATP